MADDRLTIEADLTGGKGEERDWQPYVWTPRHEAPGNAPCGRCGLPAFSLGAPEPGYWTWDGTGLAECPVLCCRCVGVPIEGEPPGAQRNGWQGPS